MWEQNMTEIDMPDSETGNLCIQQNETSPMHTTYLIHLNPPDYITLLLLFITMGWDDVPELWPPTGLMFTPTWYMSMESYCGMMLTGKTE
jgi:hypothetical protein